MAISHRGDCLGRDLFHAECLTRHHDYRTAGDAARRHRHFQPRWRGVRSATVPRCSRWRRLGFPVWAVPTVILLPGDPGHGRATRIVPDPEQFAALIMDLATSPWLGEVAGVLSGYLGDARQAEAVASLVTAVRAKNPRAIYVCDPVMGDMGGLYVRRRRWRKRCATVLVPMADIATPNRYELEWMAGEKLDDLRIGDGGGDGGRPADHAGHLGAGADGGRHRQSDADALEALLAEHRAIDRPPNGLGDLTAAVLLGAAARRPAGGQGAADRPRRRCSRFSPAPPSGAPTSCRSRPTRRACRTRWPWCTCGI